MQDVCNFNQFIFKYEMRVRERSSESSWDDRMEERKSANRRRREQSETEQRICEEQLAAKKLAEENEHKNRKVRVDQLKNELINQVAELKLVPL